MYFIFDTFVDKKKQKLKTTRSSKFCVEYIELSKVTKCSTDANQAWQTVQKSPLLTHGWEQWSHGLKYVEHIIVIIICVSVWEISLQ